MTDQQKPLAADFTFDATPEMAERIHSYVTDMTGVRARMPGENPYVLTATIDTTNGLGAERLDHVENLIRGLAPDVVRKAK